MMGTIPPDDKKVVQNEPPGPTPNREINHDAPLDIRITEYYCGVCRRYHTIFKYYPDTRATIDGIIKE